MPRLPLFLTALTCLAMVLIFWSTIQCPFPHYVYLPEPLPQIDSPADFDGFVNTQGTYIVPNFVHFVRFGNGSMAYLDAICLLAALEHHKPNTLYIHTDQRGFDDEWGKYWELVKKHPRADRIEMRYLPQPEQIFGKPISGQWKSAHAADVAKLQVLMEFGGIYLENDAYVVRNLDELRRYEMTLGWPNGGYLSNKAIVSHRHARFLKLWFDSYRDYRTKEAFFNSNGKPTRDILEANQHLIHRETSLFVEGKGTAKMVFAQTNQLWRHHYVIHLAIDEHPAAFTFDERDILNHHANIKQMALDVLPVYR